MTAVRTKRVGFVPTILAGFAAGAIEVQRLICRVLTHSILSRVQRVVAMQPPQTALAFAPWLLPILRRTRFRLITGANSY